MFMSGRVWRLGGLGSLARGSAEGFILCNRRALKESIQ